MRDEYGCSSTAGKVFIKHSRPSDALGLRVTPKGNTPLKNWIDKIYQSTDDP